MSTQKILMLILLSISIAFIYKPDLLSYLTPSKLSFTNLFNSKCSAIEEFQFDLNHEKKEHEELHHSSPTLNPLEIRQISTYKHSLTKPFTSIGTQPNIEEYKILSSDNFKHIQSFISQVLASKNINDTSFSITPTNISPNLYYSLNNNVLYFTPIELEGTLLINNTEFGKINLMMIIRGTTNKLYVPKDGFFFNKTKYEGFIETVHIINVTKNNTEPQKQRGFYARSDTINMQVDTENEMPLTTLTEIEDSEDFDLSEIIRDNERPQTNEIEPESETVSSAIDINY